MAHTYVLLRKTESTTERRRIFQNIDGTKWKCSMQSRRKRARARAFASKEKNKWKEEMKIEETQPRCGPRNRYCHFTLHIIIRALIN